MAKHIKKTDVGKAWNKRTGSADAYQLDSRTVNAKRFLIICEGKNTEPYYFRSFPVVTAEVKTFGTGRSKTSLIQYVIELISQENPDPNREIWVVFDMDIQTTNTSRQKNDFNEAIKLAHAQGFKVAYSNDSFELWFILHYQLLGSALTREEYFQRLSQLWGISYLSQCKGNRFCGSIYQKLLDDQKADQKTAIKHAERLHRQHADKHPADQNPCTTVYQLVAELNKHLKK